MIRTLQFPLRVWHGFISPALPPMCRYYPTCSVYAIQALEAHPFHRAAWLIVRRVVRCQPMFPGGYDPVPEPAQKGERPPAPPSPRNRHD